MENRSCIAVGSFLCALWLGVSAAKAQEPQTLARQFMRCSSVLVKVAEATPDKAQADRVTAASAMFTLVGATKAAGEAFVKAEMAKSVEAFVRELGNLRQRDPSPQALARFLHEQNAACRKLFSEHRAQYFAP